MTFRKRRQAERREVTRARRGHAGPEAGRVSRFAGRELFKVVLTNQPTAPCLDRPEPTGTQQIVDEFSGDT